MSRHAFHFPILTSETADAELTPCLWRGRQLHDEADTPPPPLGYNQLQSGEAWNGGPPGPDSSHSEGCKVAERQRELPATSFLQKQVSESNPAYLHRVQVSCFGCLKESVVHIRVPRRNVFYTFMNEKEPSLSKPTGISNTGRAAAVTTVKNLLHSLVAHLGSSETLQGDDGGVSPVAKQQLAGLDVPSQSCSVQGCLAEGVHSIHLQPDRLRLALRLAQTQKRNPGSRNLSSVFL